MQGSHTVCCTVGTALSVTSTSNLDALVDDRTRLASSHPPPPPRCHFPFSLQRAPRIGAMACLLFYVGAQCLSVPNFLSRFLFQAPMATMFVLNMYDEVVLGRVFLGPKMTLMVPTSPRKL